METTRDPRAIVALAALILVLLAACGSGGAPGARAPGGTAAAGTGAAGSTVTLKADPEPMGVNRPATLTVRLSDSQGKPVSGARVGIVAEHTAMSMGKLTGLVADAGEGTFTTSITPSMAGTWKVTVTAQIGEATKQAVFEVPAK